MDAGASRPRLDATLFLWTTRSNNIANASIKANANWVKGLYRMEIMEDVHQPALQAAPDRMTPLLLEHISEHARVIHSSQEQRPVSPWNTPTNPHELVFAWS